MDLSTSECSSGCESGWTMYLDQSSQSADHENYRSTVQEEDDEDLSMVSDASSGPPHFHENGGFRFDSSEQIKQKRRVKENTRYLDDTATSHFFTGSSCGQGKAAYNRHKCSNPSPNPAPSGSFVEPGCPLQQNAGLHSHDSAKNISGFSKEHKGKSEERKINGFLKASLPEKAASRKSK